MVKGDLAAKRKDALGARKAQRFVAQMDAVERALSTTGGGMVNISSMAGLENLGGVPTPSNSRSSEEINIPLFYSDYIYDVGQGPDDEFLFEEFYKKDPYIATALEIHTEVPLSKMRVGKPRCKFPEISKMVYEFFDKML